MREVFRSSLLSFIFLFCHNGVMAEQTCNYHIVFATAPLSRFVDNGNGTVTDIPSGLQWKRCSEGQTWISGTCTGSASKHTWQQALQLADTAIYASKADWRLPNIKELASIVEQACYTPAIDLAVFPNTPSEEYWSSTPQASDAKYAWHFDFYHGDDGSLYSKSTPYHVRLVRGGY